jgi:glycosyltransferase involved in cell wall biosynthesis
LLVVDDGSDDGSRDVAKDVARGDARVKLIERPHEGLVAALSEGLAQARGEFVARMDADDEMHPERLAEQVAFLRSVENAGVGLVSCLVEFGGDRVASAGYALHVDWISSLVTPDEIALNRFVESPLAHPSVMFRRELVEKFGGYRAGDFPEDYELWLRWMDAGVRMAKVPRVLLTWNDRAERTSRVDARYEAEAFFRVKARWIAREVKRRMERDGALGITRPTWVWGAGRPTRKRAAALEQCGLRIAGYVDVDPKKWTRAIGGVGMPVISPTELPEPETIFVLGYVSARGARPFIRHELRRRGFVEGRDFLMCA